MYRWLKSGTWFSFYADLVSAAEAADEVSALFAGPGNGAHSSALQTHLGNE
jgi:hypothetical protein